MTPHVKLFLTNAKSIVDLDTLQSGAPVSAVAYRTRLSGSISNYVMPMVAGMDERRQLPLTPKCLFLEVARTVCAHSPWDFIGARPSRKA